MQLHTEATETTIKEHEKTRSILLETVREVDAARNTSAVPKTDHEISQEQGPEVRRRIAEDHVLRSLRIQSMSERYDGIVEAHAATFEWIFKDPAAEDRPWSDFAQWLKSSEGIY